MQKSYPTPDRRCYTLMVVPHRGNKVYRYQMPIRFVKACLATVGAVAVFAAAGFRHYQYTLHQAQAELEELVAAQPDTRHVLLVCSAINQIDTTALGVLTDLERSLAQRGLHCYWQR